MKISCYAGLSFKRERKSYQSASELTLPGHHKRDPIKDKPVGGHEHMPLEPESREILVIVIKVRKTVTN